MDKDMLRRLLRCSVLNRCDKCCTHGNFILLKRDLVRTFNFIAESGFIWGDDQEGEKSQFLDYLLWIIDTYEKTYIAVVDAAKKEING